MFKKENEKRKEKEKCNNNHLAILTFSQLWQRNAWYIYVSLIWEFIIIIMIIIIIIIVIIVILISKVECNKCVVLLPPFDRGSFQPKIHNRCRQNYGGKNDNCWLKNKTSSSMLEDLHSSTLLYLSAKSYIISWWVNVTQFNF